MAKIVIEKETRLDFEELRGSVEGMLSEIETRRFSGQEISYEWSDDHGEMSFEGRGFNGVIEIGDDWIKIVVNLSFMLSLIAEEIDRDIEDELEKALAKASRSRLG
ncbi:MAG: polyhydroxyalkanoic acid system family protein [Desulfobacterales bacterium]|nr:polyhydroxyalkanoic acid system family protein [Desulfobacterales bacterium]